MCTYQVACGLVTLKCCLRGPSLPQLCACWCGHPIFTAKPLNGIIELYNGVTLLTHTADEVETIELYFEGHIASGDVPHAHEWQEFLRDHPRDHKQIRDKVTCR